MPEVPLLPTQEVGSLRKPFWLVEGARRGKLSDVAVDELEGLLRRVPFADANDPRLKSLLEGNASSIPVESLRELGSLFGLRFLESAGLDIVYDGEMRRVEMYEYPIRQATGFQFLGHVRSFDNKYYLKAAGVDAVGLRAPYHLEELSFVEQQTQRVSKIPVTGAYTLADWSWNEYYLRKQKGWKGPEQRRAAQREFTIEIARKVIRPTLKALVEKGAKVIQIDEPAAGTHPEETDLVVESFNESTVGIDAKLVMHICFSDYNCLFPGMLEAKRCRQFLLEFANRDVEGRDGYADLALFSDVNDGREVGLGVLDIHRDNIETPEKVEERILKAARYLKDPSQIYVNPDCGLRTRTLDVAWQKLVNMVRGTELARKKLG